MYGEGKESEILKNKEADGGRGDERQEKKEGWGAAARPLEGGESWAGGGRKLAEGREGKEADHVLMLSFSWEKSAPSCTGT